MPSQININDLTFGIEIETTIPYDLCEVGGYRSGASVSWLPAGWQAKADGSIHAGRGRRGCEFVSPPLRGSAGIREVMTVLAELNHRGARVNTSTGLHVHIGWNSDARALDRLITLVANFEKAIYAATGTTRRERGSWCGGVQRHQNVENARSQASLNRYHLLNLTNLVDPSRPNTVEFRAFAGTLNATKVVGYIRMCLGMVERAITASRVTNWAAKQPKESSPIARKGVGQTELTRLYYQLGWVKGRQSHVFGGIGLEDPEVPALAKVRKELMRLARKYDGQ